MNETWNRRLETATVANNKYSSNVCVASVYKLVDEPDVIDFKHANARNAFT